MERGSLNPLKELAFLLRLRRLLMREKPSLIHNFTIKCAVYGSITGRLCGVRARINAVAGMGYVFTSADLKARLLRPAVTALLRLALGGNDARLILQNKDDVALFQSAGLVDAKRIRIIPGSGVDCTRFVTRKETDRSPPLRVLLAARLLWDKGVAEYIAAARQLLGKGRKIRFILAGAPDPGNPAAVPVEEIGEWVKEGVVEWLGHVDDMARLLASVDIMVLPSYREGLPKGLIEGGASGLPLVTTDVPGCRDVVTDGVDGLLVPARSADALADAIAKLEDDPDMAASLGRAAREKVLLTFEERIIVRSTVGVYHELLGVP